VPHTSSVESDHISSREEESVIAEVSRLSIFEAPITGQKAHPHNPCDQTVLLTNVQQRDILNTFQ
jgi:hypothetical protein